MPHNMIIPYFRLPYQDTKGSLILGDTEQLRYSRNENYISHSIAMILAKSR